MKSKLITYKELQKAIEVTFNGDTKIFENFDKNVPVKTYQEVIDNVLEKIRTYSDCQYLGFYVKGEIAGYAVYQEKLLISFGIKPSCRTTKDKNRMFQKIKEHLSKPFYCHLWSRNVRAIKWLVKQKLTIVESNPSYTQLICM